MTPILHFSSSSNRAVHTAKLTYGDKTLFRALFRGVTMSHFKRSPVPECQALTESQQFDLVERAVNRARVLAKSSSDTTKLETCSNCASASPVDGAPERVFCSLWKVSCSHTANCYKFERSNPSASPRRLFPGEVPQPGDLYPDLDGKLVAYKGLASDWCGLAKPDEWQTRRATPPGWEIVVAAEFNPLRIGDVIVWNNTNTGIRQASRITSSQNAKWFTERMSARHDPRDASSITAWRRRDNKH